jgi:hypothetical protein
LLNHLTIPFAILPTSFEKLLYRSQTEGCQFEKWNNPSERNLTNKTNVLPMYHRLKMRIHYRLYNTFFDFSTNKTRKNGLPKENIIC